ncbi:FmdB family zinc ribbon protein [Pseudorhodoferax sp.]|uniref:FmdB family zinc ribbon protein n=1 Tax=Pseudorhodoferax sp. TaxID=1993553 RepID=UPI002DD62D1D|nr:FmdB family zinc ribbon protein [Pseudorhodoferax sp.]
MPIYAYRCESCGHAKDVLQKISDAPLTVCPQCGAEAFRKQLTAAGFQLKGSGWYVTDFRNNGSAAPAAKPGDGAPAPAPAAPADAAASPAPAPAAAPAASPAPPPSSSSSGST